MRPTDESRATAASGVATPDGTPAEGRRNEYLLIGWPVGPGRHFRVASGATDQTDLIRQLRDAASLADDVASLATWIGFAAQARGLAAHLVSADANDVVFDLG
jgi:hypothetical protein